MSNGTPAPAAIYPATQTEVDPSIVEQYVNPGPQAAFWHQTGEVGGQSAVGGTPLPDYSFSEQANGRLWVDGSNIYQKTIDLKKLPIATTGLVPHNIEGLAYVVELQGAAVDPSGPYFIRLPHVDATDLSYGIGTYVDGTNIQITTGIDRSSFHGYCTLIYTCTDR